VFYLKKTVEIDIWCRITKCSCNLGYVTPQFRHQQYITSGMLKLAELLHALN